jgi:hypothetical protein
MYRLPDILIRDSILAVAAGPNIGYYAYTNVVGKERERTLLIKNSIVYLDPTYTGGGKTPIEPGFPFPTSGKIAHVDSHIFSTVNNDTQLRLIISESNFHTNGWRPPDPESGDTEACVHYDNSGNDFFTEVSGTYTNVRSYLGSAVRNNMVDDIKATKETKSPIEYMNIL